VFVGKPLFERGYLKLFIYNINKSEFSFTYIIKFGYIDLQHRIFYITAQTDSIIVWFEYVEIITGDVADVNPRKKILE